MLKHGVTMIVSGENVIYEFWWCGERISLADFNERLINQTRSVANDLHDFSEGFKLKESINDGSKTVAKIEQIEEILKLPLCDKCRSMIGGDLV